MGRFFFDESIHDIRGGFILGAWVYAPSGEDVRVEAALRKNGLTPAVDEFKSSAHMGRNPVQAALREDLAEILEECRIGVVVLPSTRRSSLGVEACAGLKKILEANGLLGERHDAFLDEGIVPNASHGHRLAEAIGLDGRCTTAFEQDSRVIYGLQLADLAAHTCATMLLESLGLVTKKVRMPESSGQDREDPVELGFELWARIRYSFFCSDDAPVKDALNGETDPEAIAFPLADISACALHIAEACDDILRAAASGRFGQNYLGCIH